MTIINIKTIVNADYFRDNRCTLNTPIEDIPVINPPRNQGVWMIADKNVISGQASPYSLTISAKKGDEIRWWDSPIAQNEEEIDIMIIGFCLRGRQEREWNNVFSSTTSCEKPVGMASIDSGLKINNIHDLKFSQSAFKSNCISAIVRNDAPTTTLYYYLILGKFDVSHTGEAKLKGIYQIDPVIRIGYNRNEEFASQENESEAVQD